MKSLVKENSYLEANKLFCLINHILSINLSKFDKKNNDTFTPICFRSNALNYSNILHKEPK